MDLTPLTAPVDRRALRAYIERARTPQTTSTGLSTAFWALTMTVLLLEVITALIFFFEDGRVPMAILLGGPVIIAGFGLIQLLRWLPRRPHWRSRYRVSRFAEANGLDFIDSIPYPAHDGMIFGIGTERLSTAVVWMPGPRPVEIGNHRYVLEADDENSHSVRSRMHRWGYLTIRLDVPLPHIVLDARRNDRPFGSNLPFTPAKDQRLSLEGDVDRHFTLYCPTGYETDALYLFTPDVLAHLIDDTADFDIEIVDDRLYLYSSHEMSTADPRRWERLLRIADVLQTKLDQWARWRDARLPAERGRDADVRPTAMSAPTAGVAKAGRRLRRAVPWIAIVLGILYVIFGVVTKFF